ncbi:hypothetical protein [Paenibacillus sp. IITD108]|uniref:hypothetical protein n=1 Tax=Paenibacillus sp. IITD108 TaxID=3116649 RepID=UPI002F3E5B8E
MRTSTSLTRRWKKNVTRKEKQQKYSLEERMILTKENKNDFSIILALYFYRALSSDQIYRLGVTGMKKNTLWSKMTYLTERKVIKTIVDTDKPTGSLNSKYRYILTDLGLQVILDVLQIPLKLRGEPKQYFSLMDLRLGSQKKHHYLSVDWVSRVQQRIKPLQIPDSEWRRYLNGDPNISTTIYKPDWIMYEPHIVHNTIIENERFDLHPFVYPLTIRDEVLTEKYSELSEGRTWDWKSFYKPMLVLEMDTGTMNHKELKNKYLTILDTLKREQDRANLPKLLVFCNYVERFSPRFNEDKTDNLVLELHPNSKKRLRNTRKYMCEVLHQSLLEDELTVLHGDEFETVIRAADYISNNQQFVFPERLNDLSYLQKLFSNHSSNLSIFTPASEQGKAWCDLTSYGAGLPDFIVKQDDVNRINDRFNSTAQKIDFVYYARNGWVNPQLKAATFEKWIKSGGEWPFVSQIRVILLYPSSKEFHDDIFPVKFSTNIYFASFEELEVERKWDEMYVRVPVFKKGIRWEKITGVISAEAGVEDE